MVDDTSTITRRNVIKAAGASFAVGTGVGASGSATAGPMECVAATSDAQAYDTCPAISYVTYVEEGRTGTVRDTCFDEGYEYKLVDFDCVDSWWIRSTDLVSATDCFC